MADESTLDPVEALKHIRAVLEAATDKAYGTPLEATFQEIRTLVDRALPPEARSADKAARIQHDRGGRVTT